MTDYAIAELVDAPYNDTFGWAPSNTTDSYRLGSQPLRDFREGPDDTQSFHGSRDAGERARESETSLNAVPVSGVVLSAPRFAPNPRSIPVAPDRVTATLRPSFWAFFRNMLGRTPHRLNGTHFSMADHARNYEILGMAPQRSSRSTYRAESPTNGLSVVDMPPVEQRESSATILAVRTPNPTNAYRL